MVIFAGKFDFGRTEINILHCCMAILVINTILPSEHSQSHNRSLVPSPASARERRSKMDGRYLPAKTGGGGGGGGSPYGAIVVDLFRVIAPNSASSWASNARSGR